MPATPNALIAWSPGAGDVNQFMLKTPAELNQKLPQFEAHSQLLNLAPDAVLQSPALKRYIPVRPLPVQAPLPAEIVALLGWPQQATYAPGAYQPVSR
ncbi:MAG: hypothetical protein PSV13_01960 [Lacunisphaera sp.]|nr:hypothetical protein [Lacunisphaera sp.]